MAKNKKGNRLEYIDIARGLAMFCIVLGHLGISEINRFVFTFHVPIFFLITGYFINDKSSVKEFVSKRFKTLIVPYVWACVAVIVSALLMNRLYNFGDNWFAVFLHWEYASIYGAGDSYNEPFTIFGIGAIWFLLATFWGSIVLRITLETNRYIRLMVIATYFVVSIITAKMLWLPLSIQAGGTAVFYMYIGYIIKMKWPDIKQLCEESKIGKISGVIILIASVILWITFIVNFRSFWLVHCDIGRGAIDILNSLAACLVFTVICYAFSLIKFKPISLIFNSIGFLGRNSLIMLCFHIVELDTFPWWKWVGFIFDDISHKMALMLIIIAKMIWIAGGTVVFVNVKNLLIGNKKN